MHPFIVAIIPILWAFSGAFSGFLGSICFCSILKSYGCFCGESGVHCVVFIVAASMALSVVLSVGLLGKLRKSHL